MHRDLCDLGSQIQIRILPKERTHSFLYLTFTSLFYMLLYLYIIHLLILFTYLSVCFHFYGWCDILTILPTQYM